MFVRYISLIALAAGILPSTSAAKNATSPESATTSAEANQNDIVVSARLAHTAREEQKAAPNLIDIQSAESIAKYPDVNAAEALSRLPGVALSIDTAEGRFINIRGLDGNFNGATMGGVVLLNTQPGGTYFNSAGRAVEFDTVPIGAVDRMSVIKTGLPDHDAEGIGGSVELTPRTAIGASQMFADVTLGGGVETFAGKGLYRDEVVVGGPIGGTGNGKNPALSFVLSQFLYNDHRSFNDIEAGYVDAAGTPDKAFAGLELRKYDYYRQRFGYSGELDFVPSAGQRYYLRASMAGYNEHVYRNRLQINFDGNATVDPANPNGLVDTATAQKTLRDEDETHRNIVVQLGGDNHLGQMHVEYWGSYSRATYDKHFDYNSTFDNQNSYTLAYDNTSNPNLPRYTVTSGSGLTTPSNYTLSSIANQSEHDVDREWSGAGSIAMPLGLAPGDEIKLGAKLRFRDKVAMPYTASAGFNGTYSLTQDTGSAAITNFYHAGYDIGPVIGGQALRNMFAQSGAAMALNPGGYFNDTENIAAGFIQYNGTFGKLGVLGGLRFEHTHAVYRGIGSSTDTSGNTTYSPLSTGRDYDNVFPTLQLRYAVSPKFVTRATYSTGIARPGFYQTQQSTSVDLGGLTVSTGNPNLLPTYSHNFDLSLEYYLPDAGVISITGFDKELLDYVVTRTNRVDGYAGNTGIFLVSTYENAHHAHARGFEANFVDKFRGLPGLLDGLGIDANFTHVNSSVALRAGEGNVALPGTFGTSWNAAVFYEKGRTKIRLASQFESTVLFGVGSSRPTDIFQDSRYTLDLNGSYDLTRRVQLYLNVKNLTNAPLRFYEGSPNRPIQREFYDATIETGVKLKF